MGSRTAGVLFDLDGTHSSVYAQYWDRIRPTAGARELVELHDAGAVETYDDAQALLDSRDRSVLFKR